MKLLLIPGDFVRVNGYGSFVLQQNLVNKVGVILKETTESVSSPKKYAVKMFNYVTEEQSLFETEIIKISESEYLANLVLES